VLRAGAGRRPSDGLGGSASRNKLDERGASSGGVEGLVDGSSAVADGRRIDQPAVSHDRRSGRGQMPSRRDACAVGMGKDCG
jgi:hypothetical protein